MAMRKQRSPHSCLTLTLVVLYLFPSIPACGESGAAIQATAYVEAPLGFADATIEPEGRNYDSRPGSHLYWLYYPRHEGVLLQILRTSGNPEVGSLSSSSILARFNPEILREYPQAALVDLGGVTACDGAEVADVTLTLIFTDN